MENTVILRNLNGKHEHITAAQVTDLYSHVLLPSEDFYIVCNGNILSENSALCENSIYNVVPRLVGGKGGFGSMLRALGAQIEKTTNREACRDLSGRRMRDVNNEKKLKDWVERKSEREQEKAKREEERREKRQQFLAGPKHTFTDPEYHKQKMVVNDNLEDALQQGLGKASGSGPSTSGASQRKRKSPSAGDSASASKKACEWLGIEDLSDLDSDTSDDSDDSAVPGPSSISVASAVAHPGGSCSIPDGGSDSGVESTTKSKTPGNSPMDVDTVESGDDGDKTPPQTQPEPQMIGNKPDLLASLPPPIHNTPNPTPPNHPIELDLAVFTSQQALEEVGLEGLKAALMSRGLKCGGTLQQRAERLWSVRGKSKDQIDPALFAKSNGKTKGKGKRN